MSALPCGMIKGSRGINYDMEEINDQRAVYTRRIAALKEKVCFFLALFFFWIPFVVATVVIISSKPWNYYF